MSFGDGVELAGKLVEGVGVAVLVVGVVAVLVLSLRRRVQGVASEQNDRAARRGLGRVLVLGLEILVAGDIIATVAVDPTLRRVGVLAIIVVIRTFQSWSIELETDGRWPWQSRRPGAEQS